MIKQPAAMNLEEMGMVYPVILSEHNPAWPVLYSAEKDRIEKAVGVQGIVKISHIGSTAVPGMIAKPVIGILLEILNDVDGDGLIRKFSGMGYLWCPQPENPPPHLMFIKGYAPGGYSGQVYHVHVRYGGDWDEPYFCNYLIRHPAVAEQYMALKQRLRESFAFDREAYTRGKTEFIKLVMEIARKDRGKPVSCFIAAEKNPR